MKCTKRTKTEFQYSKQNCDQICRNFAPLTIIWKFLVLFWRFILYLAKCWLYPGNFLHYWAIFQCLKWPNTVKTIEPSGHTVFGQKAWKHFFKTKSRKRHTESGVSVARTTTTRSTFQATAFRATRRRWKSCPERADFSTRLRGQRK